METEKHPNQYTIGKVKMDLQFYCGEDSYSDGDIEDELLHLVQTRNNFQELLAKDNRWPLLYHLSPVRRNLLEWYRIPSNAKVLEIGAGCGAITGMLCEKAAQVVAVELSRRRAEINAYRHRDKDNLTLTVGNLNDIKFPNTFDYVTLIGVLEYAGKFTRSSQPYLDFLTKVRQYLAPGGTLILALENKFGLKYWGGAPEDHSGVLFENLEGYPKNQEIATFSKMELAELIQQAGFKHIEFYYPMPDYKMPSEIYSDQYLPKLGQAAAGFPNYDRERLMLYNEKLVYFNIIKEHKFDFFANSYLVFCQTEGVS